MNVESRSASAGCTLELRVVPNAARDVIVGWLGAALKVKVRAPARDGRANDALCEFLALSLGLPRRSVELRHGAKSRQKTVTISGLDRTEIQRRLGVSALAPSARARP